MTEPCMRGHTGDPQPAVASRLTCQQSNSKFCTVTVLSLHLQHFLNSSQVLFYILENKNIVELIQEV